MTCNRFTFLLTAFALALAVVFSLDLTPWVRGGYGWRWPYVSASLADLLRLTVVAGIYIVGTVILLRQTKRAWPVLIWTLLGTVALSITVATVRDELNDPLYALFTRTTSGLTTGQHWAATQVDWQRGEWRDWTNAMARLGGHLGTSPPGLPMLFALTNDLLGASDTIADSLRAPLQFYQCHNYALLDYTASQWASAWFGILTPLWAGLAILPLYGVASRIAEDDARKVVVWWALIPGLAAFAGSWSTVFPLLGLISFYFLLLGFEQQASQMWMVASGLSTGAALFINFALFPLLGLFGFYTLLHWWTQRDRNPLVMGLWFGLGFVLPWLIFQLIGGSSFFAIMSASLDYHLDLDRPYWFWVWFHVWDWTVFTGAIISMLWLTGIVRCWRQRTMPVLSVALLLTVLVMTISGTTQGESGRIWLFLSPFVLISAYETLSKALNERTWITLLTAQATLFIAMTAHLAVIGTDFTRPPLPPEITVETMNPQRAMFTENEPLFQLVGWQAEPIGAEVELTLHWQAQQPMDRAYWFGAFLVGSDGTITEAVDWQPNEQAGKGQRYPTTCWPDDQIVQDQIRLSLPPNAKVENWWISLATFGDGRLRVTLLDGGQDVQVGLGPMTIERREFLE